MLTAVDGFAVVTVTDSGVGIPQAMLGRVFDMFAQVDRTLDRSQGGLAIGLSLVRSLVALHGGQVIARSSGPETGSTFEIRLPAAPLPAVPAAPQPSTDGLSHRPMRPLRIIVVDDNTDAADTLGMLLEQSGHVTRVAYCAADALAAVVDFQPDAILCDLGMPGMSGHDFAATLRSDPRFASTLLVAITGWGGEEDRRRSRDAGFDFHFTKPVDTDSISRLLALA